MSHHENAFCIPQKVEAGKSIFDASSNSGELPDLNSLVGEEPAQEVGGIKRHREKNRWADCLPIGAIHRTSTPEKRCGCKRRRSHKCWPWVDLKVGGDRGGWWIV